MVQYVDWAFGDFYKKIEKKHPHTLIILTADEGKHIGEKTSIIPKYKELRKIFRLPLAIISPKMPSDLSGTEIDKLSSQVDLAPTLLSLLDWEKTKNQFKKF